jgi:hypothetical protein
MKKFYLIFTTVFALLITTTVSAQCPNPNGLAFPFKYGQGCFVFVTNTLPNADINVYDGVTKINTSAGKTGANGQGSANYDCSHTVTKVLMTLQDGTVCEISGNNIAVLATLPVKLSDFNAKLKGSGAATISWTSEYELESEKYVVQRSVDGRNFVNIGELPSAGSAVERRRYSLDDANLGDNAVFYRLLMVDIDGKTSLSKVIYVNNKKGSFGKGTLKIFPNPFKSDLQLIGISAADVNRRSIRLYNVAGKEIGFTVTGANAISIDANAPSGVYVLRVNDKTFKLVKE